MTLIQAIDARRSRRAYLPSPIDPTSVSELQALIAAYSKPNIFRMELVTENRDAFRGFLKSYGLLSGVTNFIGLIADQRKPTAIEQLGYYGELLILHAVTMGLGTCWVGGSFSRASMPFCLSDTEKLIGVIALGNTSENGSRRERFFHRLIHRKGKAAEELFISDQTPPDWFLHGMTAVQKAPSSLHRQPVRFTYRDGVIEASVKNADDAMLALDLGIAKLHFELGAGDGSWTWGNPGTFVRS